MYTVLFVAKGQKAHDIRSNRVRYDLGCHPGFHDSDGISDDRHRGYSLCTMGHLCAEHHHCLSDRSVSSAVVSDDFLLFSRYPRTNNQGNIYVINPIIIMVFQNSSANIETDILIDFITCISSPSNGARDACRE